MCAVSVVWFVFVACCVLCVSCSALLVLVFVVRCLLPCVV